MHERMAPSKTHLIAVALLVASPLTLPMDQAARAEGQVWSKDITSVYVCSSEPRLTAKAYAAFAEARPDAFGEVVFHEGWQDDTLDRHGPKLVIAASSKPLISQVEGCLAQIAMLPPDWLKGVGRQAAEIGKRPNFAPEVKIDVPYGAMRLSERHRFSDKLIFYSLVFHPDEQFDLNEMLASAFELNR
jgi:hypothetical protein